MPILSKQLAEQGNLKHLHLLVNNRRRQMLLLPLLSRFLEDQAYSAIFSLAKRIALEISTLTLGPGFHFVKI